MDNCDIWAEVDFGEGPVRIRCTEFGRHTDHICRVELVDSAQITENESDIRHNIFDEEDVSPANVRPAHKPPYNFLQ